MNPTVLAGNEFVLVVLIIATAIADVGAAIGTYYLVAKHALNIYARAWENVLLAISLYVLVQSSVLLFVIIFLTRVFGDVYQIAEPSMSLYTNGIYLVVMVFLAWRVYVTADTTAKEEIAETRRLSRTLLVIFVLLEIGIPLYFAVLEYRKQIAIDNPLRDQWAQYRK